MVNKFKIIVLIYGFLFGNISFAQEFYVNNSNKITAIFKPIQSDWVELNINESQTFLKNSGLTKIKQESADNEQYVTGTYAFENYVFQRTLIFQDKVIIGYFDNVDFITACLLCVNNELLKKAGNNSFLRDFANENMAKYKKSDEDIKELVLNKFYELCNKDGLHNLKGDMSNDLYNINKSNFSRSNKVIRNCKVEIEDDFFKFHMSKIVKLNTKTYEIGAYKLKDVNVYDLQKMIEIFLLDCKLNGLNFKTNIIDAKFEPLEGNLIGLSYAKGNDNLIKIRVDPKAWSESSNPKRWYLLYHELGHDVLNLEHGTGGKMMFNFADRGYSWNEFWEDKNYMLKNFSK